MTSPARDLERLATNESTIGRLIDGWSPVSRESHA